VYAFSTLILLVGSFDL